MDNAKDTKKTEPETIKKAEAKPTPQKATKTRYFIGKEQELTEAQAKAHVKKQTER